MKDSPRSSRRQPGRFHTRTCDAVRLPDILQLEISERHVLDEASAAAARVSVVADGLVLSLPRLDPRRVGGIDQMHILVQDVLHIIRLCGKLAHGADGHAVRVVAGDVLGVDVGAVAFDGDTVVTFLKR